MYGHSVLRARVQRPSAGRTFSALQCGTGSAENDDSRRNGPLKRDAFKGNPLWNITLSSKEFSMPVAYITGATSGIGRATAERFIEEGWTGVVLAIGEERLQ